MFILCRLRMVRGATGGSCNWHQESIAFFVFVFVFVFVIWLLVVLVLLTSHVLATVVILFGWHGWRAFGMV